MDKGPAGKGATPLRAMHFIASLPPVKKLRHFKILRDFWLYVREKQVPRFADRQFLESRILPVIAAAGFERVLFVGCRRYTQGYGRYFAESGTEYWTTDIDPEASRWGDDRRHVVCDIREADLHFPAAGFDAILLNGVFGFGVDDEAGMSRTIKAIGRILRPGGVLLIGWNDNLTKDPLEMESLRARFTHGSILPIEKRTRFDDATHVFDFVTRRGAAC